MDVDPLERLITKLAVMKRQDLIGLLRSTQCAFPVDFTEEYLASLSLERLRHIVLAITAYQEKACA